MTQYTRTIPCTITYTYNPEEFATRHEPYVQEEFYVDSVKINGVEFLELLGIEADDEIYKLLKGLGDE